MLDKIKSRLVSSEDLSMMIDLLSQICFLKTYVTLAKSLNTVFFYKISKFGLNLCLKLLTLLKSLCYDLQAYMGWLCRV